MGRQVPADQARLVDALCASGAVGRDWQDAFRAVPRQSFVPGAVWYGERPPLRPVVRQDDPTGWMELVHSDEAIVTQVDDGATAPGQPGRYPTSSISQPSVVAMMLDRTQLAAGHRVLEIGTGTGYNTALLAHRLGTEYVTTIEIDPAVAESARAALDRVGFGAVPVITGDGALGYPPGGPYDRILSTAACHTVPYGWIEQTRPGGRIITPWGTSYSNGVLLHLEVTPDGGAIGGLDGNVAFMWLREQRIPFGWLADQPEVSYERQTTESEHPYRLNYFSASFAVGLLTPGCQYHQIPHDDDPYDAVVWLFDPATGSRAAITVTPHATEFPIRQHGPRYLWDEAKAAYDWWVSVGSPDYRRFGLTVTPGRGQHVWLDSPEHPLPTRPCG